MRLGLLPWMKNSIDKVIDKAKGLKLGNPSTNMSDFGFAFNNIDYSDRVLHIEIMTDSLDYSDSGRKKLEEKNGWLSYRMIRNGFSHVGDETAHINDSNCSPIIKVETLHINSLILAEKSPFFYKLFKNGMRESQQKDVTLRIDTYEEAEALLDILEFMYRKTLRATTNLDLLGVLIVADKFEVTSCMIHCCEMLKKKPMSLESALLYLELPSSLLASKEIQPLLDVTKQYLVAHCKDLNKSHKEMMDLPLCAIEAVLGSDGVQVDSEDDVFEFIVKWARAHYPKLKECREILADRLVHCICFPQMSSSKLKEVLACVDFGNDQVTIKLVLEALFVKVEDRHSQQGLTLTNSTCLERIYKYKYPRIRVVRFELAQPCGAVYFDLKKEECENLIPLSKLDSPLFCLGGPLFKLYAQCETKDQQSSFGLYLCLTEESVSCAVNFEFAAMKKSTKMFENKAKSKNNFSNSTRSWGFWNLLGIPWTDFIYK